MLVNLSTICVNDRYKIIYITENIVQCIMWTVSLLKISALVLIIIEIGQDINSRITIYVKLKNDTK